MGLQGEMSERMVQIENFNLYEDDGDKLIEYLRKNFILDLKNYPNEQPTRKKTGQSISAFFRYMHLIYKPRWIISTSFPLIQ